MPRTPSIFGNPPAKVKLEFGSDRPNVKYRASTNFDTHNVAVDKPVVDGKI